MQRLFSVAKKHGQSHPERGPLIRQFEGTSGPKLCGPREGRLLGRAWLFGCFAISFWKHVAVQMLPFLQATKRTAPPPALESNTWPTYNFHLRFFQVHHYQKNQLPFSRVTVQRVRLRREGKQCRSCLRAQWANPSDAEPPVAFAEAGEAGERMKHHESQLDAKQTTNTVVGKTIWQTTNTVVGDCFFSNLKGVWWVSYDSHGPMTPGATGNKGEIACFENMFCGCLANRSTQTAFVVCFVCHPQQRRMCFGLFRWKMIGCCQRSWSRISWTQAWMTVWIKANQISCLPTEIHHFDSALLGCQWGLWRNFPR